jgi:GH24 family phage-related lysozyme (muramidase)
MWTSVSNTFPHFTSKFEGRISWMYLDKKGLVTIGLGCLIEPSSLALQLPFTHISSGTTASTNEIEHEWRRIKMQLDLAQKGAKAAKLMATLQLSEKAIDDLARVRLAQNEAFLKTVFHDFDAWPADAQLGVHSMAWAMGAGFMREFPKFTAACKARDWKLAAAECKIDATNNEGLIPRNAANKKLFLTAAEKSALPIRIIRGYP